MGIRARWSRAITVDDVRYRYHVAEDHCGGLNLQVCIQQVEPAGQRLLCELRKPLTWSEGTGGDRVGTTRPHAVTPRVIRRLILAARGRGWWPATRRLGAFHLPADEVVADRPQPFGPSGPPGAGRRRMTGSPISPRRPEWVDRSVDGEPPIVLCRLKAAVERE